MPGPGLGAEALDGGTGNDVPAKGICDCFPRLKEVTLARAERYRKDPEAKSPVGPQSYVLVTVTSVGDLNEVAESGKSGRTWAVSEPQHVGGLADAPSPLEYLLSGAVGCFAAVFAFYAAKLDVPYSKFVATARAEFDKRGHVLEDAPPAGFTSVQLDVQVTSTCHREDLERVLDLAVRGCPGIATLRDPVPINPALSVTYG